MGQYDLERAASLSVWLWPGSPVGCSAVARCSSGNDTGQVRKLLWWAVRVGPPWPSGLMIYTSPPGCSRSTTTKGVGSQWGASLPWVRLLKCLRRTLSPGRRSVARARRSYRALSGPVAVWSSFELARRLSLTVDAGVLPSHA